MTPVTIAGVPIGDASIACACGCGQVLVTTSKERGMRKFGIRFLSGHQNRGRRLSEQHKKKCARPMSLNGRWNGGKFVDAEGYILVKRPDHPAARKSGYVLEHRLVAEQKLGRRLLRDEVVHHINGDKQDNVPENIIVTIQSEHVGLDRRGKQFPRANGLWLTCEHCKRKFYKSAWWATETVRHCSWKCRYPRSSE